MKVFRYLDIDDHQIVSEKLYHYIETETDILTKKWAWTTLQTNDVLKHIPELEQKLQPFNFSKIYQISIIYRSPGVQGPPHIDSKKLVRALWPVKNCEGSFTKFFDLNGNDVISKLDDEGNSYLHIEAKNPMPEIHAVELVRPIVFNTGVPHGVYTNPKLTGPRISATIAFVQQPKDFLQF